jgi:CTD kinase subunit beta
MLIPCIQTFNRPSELIIGLERLILETIGFDFRVRYPQKHLIKAIRKLVPPEDAKALLAVAYDMSIDIYKSFAPIKQTTFTTVMAIVELAALMTSRHVDKIRSVDLHRWHTNRGCVVETMLDLLDLYAQFPKSTKVGLQFPLDKFIQVKIGLNKEVEASRRLGRFETWCDRCEAEVKDIHPITPGSATSPATTSSYPGTTTLKRPAKSTDATMRFVFDEDEARREEDIVMDFFREEYEEYEVEVEERIPDSEQNHARPNGPRQQHNNHDHGWAPYHRNGRHGHHHDRHKGRKGHGGNYY